MRKMHNNKAPKGPVPCTKLQEADILKRLRDVAKKFHSKADKSVPLRKFSAKVHSFKRTSARRYAAHVAAWLAFAPKRYVPGATEIKLLHSFLLQVGGGQLPTRLQQILPLAQNALERVAPTDALLEEACEKLKKRLRSFSCCRSTQQSKDCSAADKSPEAEGGEEDQEEHQRNVGHAVEAGCEMGSCQESDVQCNAGDPGRAHQVVCPASGAQPAAVQVHHQAGSASSQRLFQKMNEWQNMAHDEKLACFKSLSQRTSCTPSSEATLADVLHAVAAVLSPPRQETASSSCQDDDSGSGLEASSAAEVSTRLQQRARALLLWLLRDWQAKGFDCQAIHAVLEHVKWQVSTFETKVGEIRLAAASSVWSAIRDVIKDLQNPSCMYDPAAQQAEHRKLSIQAGIKNAVVKAVSALGGTATNKQVRAYLRKHVSCFEKGVDDGTLARSIQNIRLARYLDSQGKDLKGEDLFTVVDKPVPRGVRRHTHGYTARMDMKRIDARCVGPFRCTAEDASRDYQKMQQWRASMTEEAVACHVRNWTGARVLSACRKCYVATSRFNSSLSAT